MKALAFTALAIALTAAATGWARAQEELVTDISQHLISIESNFTGADLLMFGTVGGTGSGERDIVIVVRGPDTPIVVRRKERVGGIWINYGSVTLENVPGFYSVASTRPLDQITSAATLERYQIGTAYISPRPVNTNGAVAAPYIEAVSRIRKNEGLFREQPEGVRFLGSSLFRASIDMPANVPDGRYTARVYLFGDGRVIQAQTSTLFVNKAGFERVVFDFAQDRSLAYGIVSVIVACFAGWVASAIFRRA